MASGPRRDVASKALDGDAPYIVESYQNDTAQFNGGPAPSFTYTHNPGSQDGDFEQPRSWEDAARAQATPEYGHVYVNIDPNNPQHSIGGTYASPTPLHATITGYATSLGWPLSTECAIPYVFPPFTSVFVLIFETKNDLARFHAFQAALCSVAAILAELVLRHIFGLVSLAWILLRLFYLASWYCGYIAHQSAVSLERAPFVPIVGPHAVSFVGEE
ncbi:hypothetical protein MVES1_001997 [Malassezia vespertilionis]|uniref:Uncharacterized protein n=1 Tax=Malassezia vespertilionis TaxID=2020962 RepID=A0A2N1JBG0_9BASI|nr:uncharacterized protein MVES1_001997 [Malassezia vespertilionis]PKI83890.1 hypothetical protein MVES_001890 [Malassezia vespertilionis]WFD06643.1 hypothetical protein MVES1_001997 [Malassezia vespertilionis]